MTNHLCIACEEREARLNSAFCSNLCFSIYKAGLQFGCDREAIKRIARQEWGKIKDKELFNLIYK